MQSWRSDPIGIVIIRGEEKIDPQTGWNLLTVDFPDGVKMQDYIRLSEYDLEEEFTKVGWDSTAAILTTNRGQRKRQFERWLKKMKYDSIFDLHTDLIASREAAEFCDCEPPQTSPTAHETLHVTDSIVPVEPIV